MHQSSNPSVDPVTQYHWLEFENRRLKISGDEFQRLFEDIMVRAKPGFIRIRPYGKLGDRKCDGLFQADSTIYQVYSPDELKQADLQKKINEDLDGAVQHWKDGIKKWIFVYNDKKGGLPPDIPSLLEKKKQQYPNITIEHLSNDGLWELARGLTIQQRTEILGAPASNSNFIERQAWLDAAMQRSKARCIARWQSIGVSRNDAVHFTDDASIGSFPLKLNISPSKLIILTGEMGIGKSLIGERVFQSAIRLATENFTMPIPLFFEAWQLQNKSLEQEIRETTCNLCNPTFDSVLLIIDGVDAIGVTNAIRLLGEARMLIEMWQQSSILLISKPILELNSTEELVNIPLLSKETSEELIRRLSNLQHFSIDSLPKVLQDAIFRPLFAVLLGIYLKERGVWTLESKEQLLSNLVERSLRPIRENIVRVSNLLEQLAAICINRGGKAVPSNEILSWVERQQLIDSKLVVENQDKLQFPIPILNQWFGAQYLLKNNFYTESSELNRQKLEFWGYPLAIAVATFPLQRVSELLAPIAEKEPLITADIVSEALAFEGRSMEMPSLSAWELGQQVRIAMQAWINGFTMLTSSIAPHLENEKLPTIGVRISRQKLETDPPTNEQIIIPWVEIAWHSGSENLPNVVELPPDIDSNNLSSRGWKSISGFPPYLLGSWIWKWTLEQVVHLLLKRRSIPIRSSLLSLEAAWHGASNIIERDNWDSNPISLSEIETRLVEVERISCMPMMHHCLKQLGIEMEAAHAKGLTHLRLPGSFQLFWSNPHTDEALLAYARDVHTGGFEGYLRLVDTLSPFIPKLKYVSILPARLIVVLVLPDDSDSISIIRYWEPLPANDQNEIELKLSKYSYAKDYASLEPTAKQWIALRPQWWQCFVVNEIKVSPLTKFWLGPNAVTELAYEFLWEDFKRMGWVNSSLGGSGFPYTY